jgi:hypothetical protein
LHQFHAVSRDGTADDADREVCCGIKFKCHVSSPSIDCQRSPEPDLSHAGSCSSE